MEAAVRRLLEESFGEYVSGGLGNIDASRFPLTLRDLKLNEKKIQEGMDEDGGGIPFEFNSGKIGSVSVNPGWLSLEICVTNIVLNFSFSAVKAMHWAMKKEEQEDDAGDKDEEQPEAMAPSVRLAPVAPRYCRAHDSSEKRTKTEPRFEECTACGLRLQTNYSEFALCPPCSEKQQKCMICASHAPTAGSYVPGQTLQTTGGPGCQSHEGPRCHSQQGEVAAVAQLVAPRFCAAHDTSEKRLKTEPRTRECTGCFTTMQTTYADFALCPACSDRQERCMLCGAGAPTAGSYVPARRLEPPPAAEEACSGAEGGPAAASSRGAHRLPQEACETVPFEEEFLPGASGGGGGSGGAAGQRPLPQGRWREGSRAHEKGLDAPAGGCGLPCAGGGPGGEGLMGFVRIFDIGGVFGFCNAEAKKGAPAGGVQQEHAPRLPASLPPRASLPPWQQGRAGGA